MFLLEKEKILLESDPTKRFSFYVTNYRIRWESREGSKLQVTSIMLEEISSIELAFRHNFDSIVYGIIMLGLLAAAGTFVGDHFADPKITDIGWYGGLACLVIGLLMYIPTRKYEINFACPTTSILVNVKGLSEQDIQEMIEAVESAKLNKERLLRDLEKNSPVKKIVLKAPVSGESSGFNEVSHDETNIPEK